MPAPTLLSPGAILYLNSNIPPQPLQLNMGQRHNRKRTRSRPRNRRNNHARDSSVDSSFSFSSESSFLGQPSFPQFQRYTTFSNPSAAHWHQQYSAWHVRQELQQQQQQQSVENQRLRMFGGEAADGADLCGPMLKVVMDLFDDIDYIDP
ncbi:hypothetical protein DBV05_g8365 [Lasiodiplodia theobromae]|uniref:Uncharacterized protein n=2 Tax=Lasiodiplodia theobromae TaxID=45133 RepID=A0A5N5D5S5_9PEZI|nr:hypothetical protein DBV05_g8365 [Lasiodiplodia theobromae]